MMATTPSSAIIRYGYIGVITPLLLGAVLPVVVAMQLDALRASYLRLQQNEPAIIGGLSAAALFGLLIASIAWSAGNRRRPTSVKGSLSSTAVGPVIGVLSAVGAWNVWLPLLRRNADIVWILWSVAGGAYIALLVASAVSLPRGKTDNQGQSRRPEARQTAGAEAVRRVDGVGGRLRLRPGLTSRASRTVTGVQVRES